MIIDYTSFNLPTLPDVRKLKFFFGTKNDKFEYLRNR